MIARSTPRARDAEAAPERIAERIGRARRALSPSGRRLVQIASGGWAVLANGDRRRRPVMLLAAVEGRTLVERGEVAPADGGGYVLADGGVEATEAPSRMSGPGPGVFSAAGFIGAGPRTAGAGFVGLARKAGEPGAGLSLRQAMAGLRLIADAEASVRQRGLTMNWTAAPASRARRAGRDGGLGPAALNASRRLARLRNANATSFALAWAACVEGVSLVALERRFDLPKRGGAAALATALESIAAIHDG